MIGRRRDPSCIVCGNPLPDKRKRYCSDQCKREMKANILRYEHKKKIVAKEQSDAFADIIEGMQKEGLSYGEYVARHGL